MRERLYTEKDLNMYIKIAYGVLTDTSPANVLNMCAHIRQLRKADSSYPLILMHSSHPQLQKA
jgi:hypothetical protein